MIKALKTKKKCKEATRTLGSKFVIGDILKSDNKCDPDPDQPEKLKPKLKL